MTDEDDVGAETVVGVGAVGPKRAPVPDAVIGDHTTIDPPKFDEAELLGDDTETLDDDARPTGKIERAQKPAMRAISMKTPMADGSKPEKIAARKPEVRLSPTPPRVQAPPQPSGRLAPPRNAGEVRVRRARDAVLWGSLTVMLASIVALVIWLIAGR